MVAAKRAVDLEASRCLPVEVEGDWPARRHQLPARQEGNSFPEFSLLPKLLHHLPRRVLNELSDLGHSKNSGPWTGGEIRSRRICVSAFPLKLLSSPLEIRNKGW